MKKGFTLIEMLVTIIIITIITAISASSFKNYKSRTYFNDAVSQVHGEVLKAQSLAMSPSEVGIESYTLTITDNEYTIMANNGTDPLDSGTINRNVSLSPNPTTITFEVGTGVVSEGNINITVSDVNPSSGFSPKIITISAAGSVELR